MPVTTTTGIVQQVTILAIPPDARNGCAWIGPYPTNVQLFTVYASDSDPPPAFEDKVSMLRALETALAARLTVMVVHDAGSTQVKYLHVFSAGAPV